MAKYKDNKGKDRFIRIGGKQMELGIEWGIDLYNLQDIAKFTTNTSECLKLIHYLQGSKLAFSDWMDEHTGDAADRCIKAFLEALLDFFPSSLSKPLEAWLKVADMAINSALERLETMPKDVQNVLEKTSGESQDSLESTQEESS